MCKLLRRLFWLALLGGAGYAVYTAVQGRRAEPEGDAPSWPPLDDKPPAASGDSAPADRATVAGFADVGDAPEPDGDSAGAGDATPEAATDGGAAVADESDGQRWVPPVDGQCPDGYPIKGNDDSGIFHVPGGRFYDRTIPERCYANEDDALADGYRRSKA